MKRIRELWVMGGWLLAVPALYFPTPSLGYDLDEIRGGTQPPWPTNKNMNAIRDTVSDTVTIRDFWYSGHTYSITVHGISESQIGLTWQGAAGTRARHFVYYARGSCIPANGTGPFSAALESYVRQNFVGVAAGYSGTIDPQSGSSYTGYVRICQEPHLRNAWVVIQGRPNQSESSNTSCRLEGPAEITLSVTTKVKDVPYDMVCQGGAVTQMRVYPSGPTSVSPAPGLTIWTRGPAAAILGVPGAASPLSIRFGMDSPSPAVQAGSYHADFVYIVEPW